MVAEVLTQAECFPKDFCSNFPVPTDKMMAQLLSSVINNIDTQNHYSAFKHNSVQLNGSRFEFTEPIYDYKATR